VTRRPQSMQMMPLGHLVIDPKSIAYGVLKPGPHDSDGVPLIRIKDLAAGTIDTSELHYITPKLHREFKRTELEGGEVLISIQGTVGRVAIVPSTLTGANISRTLAVLRPRSLSLAKWLLYVLQAPSTVRQIEHAVTGSTRDSLNLADLRIIEVPNTEEPERVRIVAEIEKQFSRLDEAVANLRRVKANLKRYKAAVLKAAVEGRLVPTDGGWRRAKLGDVALSIRNGFSKKPDAKQGTRIFRISAVRQMELVTSDVRYLAGPPADYDRFLVEAGDVLFTRYNGNRDYVGVCAKAPSGLPTTVYPDKLIRVRVPNSVLLPEFLVIAAATGDARAYIESKIRTTAGQSGISGSDLKSLPIHIPTLAEQHRIAVEAQTRLSAILQAEAQTDTNLLRAHTLRQSVLQRSFE
jgi:type I restriction enzyme S subunit